MEGLPSNIVFLPGVGPSTTQTILELNITAIELEQIYIHPNSITPSLFSLCDSSVEKQSIKDWLEPITMDYNEQQTNKRFVFYKGDTEESKALLSTNKDKEDVDG